MSEAATASEFTASRVARNRRRSSGFPSGRVPARPVPSSEGGTGPRRSDGELRVQVEEVQAARVDRHLHLVARGGSRIRVEAGDEDGLVLLRLGFEVAQGG